MNQIDHCHFEAGVGLERDDEYILLDSYAGSPHVGSFSTLQTEQ